MNNTIFLQIYSLSSTPFIAKLALFLSYPFTYALLFLFLVWAIFISKRKMYNFSLLFMSGFLSWVIASFLKNIFMTSRPFIREGIIPLYRETGFSFPSEHMAVFTALAVSMYLIDKRAGYIVSVIAILIGLSRMVIGVHYPVDILGGLAVGLIISLIFIQIFKKI